MARKVNKRFLVILTLIVMGGMVGAVGIFWWANRGDVQTHFARAKYYVEAAKQDPTKYQDARDAFQRALRIQPNNVEVLVAFGDMLHDMVRYDREQVNKDVQYWEAALVVDPGHAGALRRLMTEHKERAELSRGVNARQIYQKLGEYAKTLVGLEPDDPFAVACQHGAVIGQWLNGATVAEVDVNKATTALVVMAEAAMSKKAPDEPMARLYAARAMLEQARRLSDRPESIDKLYAQAQAMYADVPEPNRNPRLVLDRVRILQDLANAIARRQPPPGREERQYREEAFKKREEMLKVIDSLIAIAVETASPEQEEYAEAHNYQIGLMQSRGRSDEVPDVLQAALEVRPFDIGLRLALVRSMREMAQRRFAEERILNVEDARAELRDECGRMRLILEEPVKLDSALKGYRAFLTIQNGHFGRMIESIELKFLECTASPNNLALREEVESDVQQLVANVANREDPRWLWLEGRVKLLDSTNPRARREAVQLWQKAVDEMFARQQFDPGQVMELARLYASKGINQPGQAIAVLERLIEVQRAPQNISLLVRLLTAERRLAEADRYIRSLEAGGNGNVGAIELRIDWLRASGREKEIQPLVQALPEKTTVEKLVKANAFIVAREWQSAADLLAPLAEAEIASKEGQYAACRLLMFSYEAQAKMQKAVELAQRLVQADPKNADVQRLHASLTRQGPDTRPAGEDGNRQQEAFGQYAEHVKRAAEWESKAKEEPDKRDQHLKEARAERDQAADVLLTLEKTEVADQLAKGVRNPLAGGPVLNALFEHYYGQWQSRGFPAVDANDPARVNPDPDLRLVRGYAEKLELANWDSCRGQSYWARVHLGQGTHESSSGNHDAAQRHYESARIAAEEAVRQTGEFASSWVLLGQAQRATGQYDEAIRSFTKARERQSNNAYAIEGIIGCCLRLRDSDKLLLARRTVDEAERLFGQADWVLASKMDVEEASGNVAKVTGLREEFAKRGTSGAQSHLALASNYAKLHDTLLLEGKTVEAREIRRKMIASLETGIKKYPDSLDIVRQLAHVYWQQGDRDKATEVLKELAETDAWKARHEVAYLLAEYAVMQGDYEGAEGHFRIALQHALPDAAVAIRLRIAQLCFVQKRAPEGIAILTDVASKTENPRAVLGAVEVLMGYGRREEADTVVQAALRRYPGNVQLLIAASRLRLMNEDVRGSDQLIAQAIEADKGNPETIYWRGQIRLASGKINEAMADFRTTRDRSPINARFRAALAETYHLLGRTDDAIREMESAIQLSNADENTWGMLVDLLFADRRWLILERILRDARENVMLRGRRSWWADESRMWVMRNDMPKALFAAQKAVETSQTEENVLLLMNTLLLDKQFDLVLENTDRLMSKGKSPFPYWVYAVRAQAYHGKGNAADAFKEIKLAMDNAFEDATAASSVCRVFQNTLGVGALIAELEPRAGIPQWQLQLTNAYIAAQRWDKAVANTDDLVEKQLRKFAEPMQVQLLSVAAEAYTLAAATIPSALPKAQAAYTKFLELAPKNRIPVKQQIVALNNLACLLADHPTTPDPAAALIYSKRAYEMMQRADFVLPDIMDTHGWVLVLTGRQDMTNLAAGIALLRETVATPRAPVDAYYHLGMGYLLQKDFDRAATELARAQSAYMEKEAKGQILDASLKKKIDGALVNARQKQPVAGAN